MKDYEVIVIVVLAVVAFGAGLILGLPHYKISMELKNKIYHDANNSYRSYDEQIGFIISKHYEEVGK